MVEKKPINGFVDDLFEEVRYERKPTTGFLDDLLEEIRYVAYFKSTDEYENLKTIRALAILVGISLSRLLISISLSSKTSSLSTILESHREETDRPDVACKVLDLLDKALWDSDDMNKTKKADNVAEEEGSCEDMDMEGLLENAIEDVENCVPFLVDRSVLMELETGLSLADMESCVQNLQKAKELAKGLKDMSESEMVRTYCKNLDSEIVQTWVSMFITTREDKREKNKVRDCSVQQ